MFCIIICAVADDDIRFGNRLADKLDMLISYIFLGSGPFTPIAPYSIKRSQLLILYEKSGLHQTFV
ncbi:hypothetical protein CHH92_16250 [Bacillus sonorensis]|nr:hypothetical protein CHH92_16250 [Bacillus sonorensis]